MADEFKTTILAMIGLIAFGAGANAADCQRQFDPAGFASVSCPPPAVETMADQEWLRQAIQSNARVKLDVRGTNSTVVFHAVPGSGSSTAIGCWVTVSGVGEIGYGISKTMAIQHLDTGAWTIDWPEVERVAELEYDSNPKCQSPVVVSIAQVLRSVRGVVKETP